MTANNEKTPAVSIIVGTYNSDKKKLMQTLRSIITQKGISFEVIVSDDGSEKDCFDDVAAFFTAEGFTDYILNKIENNVGIVKNAISALKVAKGEYTYMISPGDMLYSEDVIAGLFSFAKERGALICFGNAVNYRPTDISGEVFEKVNTPYRPWLFSEKTSIEKMRTAFHFGGQILGVTYFRETETAMKYFKFIEPYSKYVEDSTSSAAALADNVRILHYDRNIVFYENGYGISNKGDDKWTKIIDDDYCGVLQALRQQHPKDRIIDAAAMPIYIKDKRKRRICRLLKHPVITLRNRIIEMSPVKMTDCSEEAQKRLDSIMTQ